MNNTDRLCLGCMNDNGGEEVCPICGYNSKQKSEEGVIAAGSWIKDRYFVGRVLETTGEGITYIGWDNLNNNVVYIKEYLPLGLCSRIGDVVTINVGKEYEFNNGILEFIELSKTILGLDLPGLMPVIDTIEENGTAYSIIKAAAGIPLREFLLRNGGALKWEQARPLFLPLLNTLESLHDAGVYHCGISPETIIVGRDGKLHLTGIVIHDVRNATSEFTSQIFPGFAAIEQYIANKETGSYTDVYGFAATLFRVLIGTPPMAATERAVKDNMSIPAKAAETIPPYVLSALANALQIEPENRTFSISELRAELSSSTSGAYAARKQKADSNKKKLSTKQYALIAGLSTAFILLGISLILTFTVFRDQLFPAETESSSSIVSAPSVDQFGDVDTSYDDTPIERLYDVPNFEKQKYSEILGNVDYLNVFEFVVNDTKHSDNIPEGAVIAQSVSHGQKVKRNTKIEFTISAGPAQLTIPHEVMGMSQIDAYITLLELGFPKDSIKFMERFDETKDPDTIVSTEPAAGTKISRYDEILVFVNTFKKPGDFEAYEGTDSSSSTVTP